MAQYYSTSDDEYGENNIKFRQLTNLIINRSVFVQGHIQLQYDDCMKYQDIQVNMV